MNIMMVLEYILYIHEEYIHGVHDMQHNLSQDDPTIGERHTTTTTVMILIKVNK